MRFMTAPARALSAAILVAGALTAAPQGLQGDWHSDYDKALAAAREAQKPILAVSMDHA